LINILFIIIKIVYQLYYFDDTIRPFSTWQQVISILENYQGSNNYILKLKKQIESNKKYVPTKSQCDYIVDYNSVVPKVPKKWVDIDSYFSQKLVEDNPFIKEPDKIYVEKILVEKDKSYRVLG